MIKAALEDSLYFVVGFVILLPVLAFIAFVYQRLWLWYAVPLGFPAIGLANMLGLILIVGLLKADPNKNVSPEEGVEALWREVKGSAIFLAFGYVVSFWMA